MHVFPWLNFFARKWRKRFLAKNFSGQANTGAEILPIGFRRHIIELDARVVSRIGRSQRNLAARHGPHWANVRLVSVAFRSSCAVITDSHRQKMILNIGVFDTRFGAHESRAFKLIGRAKAGFGKQPLRPDHGLAPQVPMFEQRHRFDRGLLDVKFQMIL